MNVNPLARHYGRLTPEERFRLILAASGRGDEAEQDRLTATAPRIALSFIHHMPFGLAFQEVALMIFIELLEDAALFQDADALASDALDMACNKAVGDEAGSEVLSPVDGDGLEGDVRAARAPDEPVAKPSPWERLLKLTYAAGFMLRTKVDGWKLFCERQSVPPFLLWEALPGFDRLQRVLTSAQKASFSPDGFLSWLNDVRPAGEPELDAVPVTVEGAADGALKLFRERAAWWGG
jgi:hypothetical protein